MTKRRISKLLIANRGEIAVRIIRAAKDSQIQTVAVYADSDRNAQHVRLADEAYALGGDTAAETYLVIEKLISVAKRSGANAVHPGYGFLSENADFAAAVEAAGLIWIGPPPSAINQLGDKVSARKVAEKVGAPLAPGTINPVADVKEVEAFVRKHGLPVAIKAAYG
ncbi:MAG: biotin carboxylase N-terminal domain-containing protein, partial [Aquiluna sp.]